MPAKCLDKKLKAVQRYDSTLYFELLDKTAFTNPQIKLTAADSLIKKMHLLSCFILPRKKN